MRNLEKVVIEYWTIRLTTLDLNFLCWCLFTWPSWSSWNSSFCRLSGFSLGSPASMTKKAKSQKTKKPDKLENQTIFYPKSEIQSVSYSYQIKTTVATQMLDIRVAILHILTLFLPLWWDFLSWSLWSLTCSSLGKKTEFRKVWKIIN